MIIIGIDPHPGSHTAVAMTQQGKVLGAKTVCNDEAGLASLMSWLESYEVEVCGVEGANNPFARELSGLLLASYKVIDVPPSLTSQYRSKRTQVKSDEVDAANVARAVLANPDLTRFVPCNQQEQLKSLTRTRQKLVEQRTALRLSLNTLSLASARQALEAVLVTLKTSIKALERQMRCLVRELMPELLQAQGIGLVAAATLLAEAGDVRTFRSRYSFAMFAGCAPVERSSGGQQRRQLNIRGNRRLNRVFHLIIQTRLRLDQTTQDYIAKKQAEGKTKRAALRCLKTHVARQVFNTMLDLTKKHPERWVGA